MSQLVPEKLRELMITLEKERLSKRIKAGLKRAKMNKIKGGKS